MRKPRNMEESYLLGMGVGLYWGEGTKANKNAVRLSNSDPALIREFIRFLNFICGVETKDLKFELQIFGDISTIDAEKFWTEVLDISQNQLYKTRVTPRRGKGTYKRKIKHGVMTVYYGNTKLRNELIKLLPM